MIQSTLFFVLGFLSAGFLAAMVTPAIWRRALTLTRRRMEGSMPLSLAEIQADKDKMRAQHAMETRRLEMSVKALRDKATERTIEIERGRLELMQLATERDELLAQLTEQSTELRRREEEVKSLNDRVAAMERSMEESNAGIEKTVVRLKADLIEARLTSLHEDRSPSGDLTARENAELRNEIGELAARMIAISIATEGPDSPVAKALGAPESSRPDPQAGITSLADRVRALQKTTV